MRQKSHKNENIFVSSFVCKCSQFSYIILIFTTSFPLKSSWRSGQAPDDRKKANVAKTFEKGYWKSVEASLTSGSGQIVVQGLVAHTSGQMKEKVATRNSLNGFTRGKLCLTNQIACYYKTGFVEQTRKTGLGKAVDVT